MTSYVFSIVTTFQIWAYGCMNFYKFVRMSLVSALWICTKWIHYFEFIEIEMKSLILFTSRNCFSSLASCQPPRSCQYCALSFQNTLDVISLERGDFKLSIGGLNSMFPFKKNIWFKSRWTFYNQYCVGKVKILTWQQTWNKTWQNYEPN